MSITYPYVVSVHDAHGEVGGFEAHDRQPVEDAIERMEAKGFTCYWVQDADA